MLGEALSARFEFGSQPTEDKYGRTMTGRRLSDGLATSLTVFDPLLKIGPAEANAVIETARSLADLMLPSVLLTVEAGRTEGGNLYVVNEAASGESLKAFVRARNGLPPAEALAIGGGRLISGWVKRREETMLSNVRVVSIVLALCALGLLAGVTACEGGDEPNSVVVDVPSGSADVSNDVSNVDDPIVVETDHPHWAGAAWAAFLPAAEETAVYHVVPFGPNELDLTARLVHDVEWKGGTWSQIVVGDLEPGKEGMALYVDLSTPWVARAKGVEVYSSDYTEDVTQVEYFVDPITLPLAQAAGESTTVDTTLIGKFRDHEEGDGVGVSYTVKVESYDHVYEAPFGPLTGCVKMTVMLSGEFINGQVIPIEVVAHPAQRIVFWESTPAFASVSIKEAWKK